MTKLYEGYERLDLTEGMRHKDKPDGPDDHWGAGEQMKALEYYAPHRFDLISYVAIGHYQGDFYGIGRWFLGVDDGLHQRFRWILFRDSFGSCSGCDALEGGDDGYEYVRDVLQNNTLQFLTLDDMAEYLRETEDFFWSNSKEELLRQIETIERIKESDVSEYYMKV